MANVGVVVDLVAAVEERESSLFTEEELEEVRRVVRRERVGLLGLVVFEAGVGFGFLGGGELEFELVVDFDLVVDRVRRLLKIGLRVKFASERVSDEAYKPASFFDTQAGMSLAVVLSHKARGTFDAAPCLKSF